MKDLKYAFSYTGYLSAFGGIYLGGAYSFLAPFYMFIIIPLFEVFTLGTQANLSPQEEDSAGKRKVFDFLLYLNLPLLYALLFYLFHRLNTGSLYLYEIVGMTIGMGLVCGSMGINVAHELGHRKSKLEQRIAKALLLSSLYMHFFIEHNRGHHKNVATDKDPASARQGEYLYSFWFRSILGGYFSAWQLEKERLQKVQRRFFSWSNEMIWYHLIQFIFLILIYQIWGPLILGSFLVAALIGVLLLETVNYVEHYGLRRQEISEGKYEKLKARHSWNSNHSFGRILLYELTRHSDHHLKASKKYQILRHIDESPELPTGYPGCIILAAVPPLWFRLMHKRIGQIQVVN